jgi:uncharacterized protein
MKKILFVLILYLHAALVLAQDFPEKPNPPRAVNDLAGVLSPGEEQALEQKLRNYTDTTSTGSSSSCSTPTTATKPATTL